MKFIFRVDSRSALLFMIQRSSFIALLSSGLCGWRRQRLALFGNSGPESDRPVFAAFLTFFSLGKLKKANC